MQTRSFIRYPSLWFRLVCCLVTANIVWYAVGVRAMVLMENFLYELLLETPFSTYTDAHPKIEVLLIYVMCLAPALIRFERPLALIAYSLLLAAAYAGWFILGLLYAEIIFPLTGPLLGLLTSTAVLGMLAWSDERLRRGELERMEVAKQQFTDMLVHDLKSRTSSISLSLSLLEKELPLPGERMSKLMHTIRGSTERILVQFSALLDIRKIQEGKMQLHRNPLPVSQILNDALQEYGPAGELTGVDLEVSADLDDGSQVVVDPEIFSRVMANLLWNALKHAPRGSTIELGYEPIGGGRAGIYVANRGPALPPDVRETLFQPFETGRRKARSSGPSGTGLGLAFCKLAVEAHGGSIRVESPWAGHADGVKVLLILPLSGEL